MHSEESCRGACYLYNRRLRAGALGVYRIESTASGLWGFERTFLEAGLGVMQDAFCAIAPKMLTLEFPPLHLLDILAAKEIREVGS